MSKKVDRNRLSNKLITMGCDKNVWHFDSELHKQAFNKIKNLQADVKELVGRLEINLNVFKLIKMLQESKKDFDFTNIENGISNMETLIQKHKAK